MKGLNPGWSYCGEADVGYIAPVRRVEFVVADDFQKNK